MATVVLHVNPQTGQMQILVDGAEPQVALQMLAKAQDWITQQVAGPKVFLPNGQAHVIAPQADTET